MRRLLVCGWMIVSGSWLLTACGAASVAPRTMAPADGEPPMSPVVSTGEPSRQEGDVDEWEAILVRKEGEIQSEFTAKGASTPGEPAAEAGTASDAPSQRCERVCKALSSMRRAADGICRSLSERHERCENARQRVNRAEKLVEASGCPCS